VGTPSILSVLPLDYGGNPGVNGVSHRGGPHPVKGYITYSIIQGIVYPFTGVSDRGGGVWWSSRRSA